jgi:hypothetical protein
MPSSRDDTIFAAGRREMVSSAILPRLQALGYADLLTVTTAGMPHTPHQTHNQ